MTITITLSFVDIFLCMLPFGILGLFLLFFALPAADHSAA
jgi:hypothetical protein